MSMVYCVSKVEFKGHCRYRFSLSILFTIQNSHLWIVAASILTFEWILLGGPGFDCNSFIAPKYFNSQLTKFETIPIVFCEKFPNCDYQYFEKLFNNEDTLLPNLNCQLPKRFWRSPTLNCKKDSRIKSCVCFGVLFIFVSGFLVLQIWNFVSGLGSSIRIQHAQRSPSSHVLSWPDPITDPGRYEVTL